MNIRDKERWLSISIPAQLKTLPLDTDDSQAVDISKLWVNEYHFDEAGAQRFSTLLLGALKQYPERTSMLVEWVDTFYKRYPDAMTKSATTLFSAPDAQARHLFLLWMAMPDEFRAHHPCPLTDDHINHEGRAAKPKSLAAVYIWKKMATWFSQHASVTPTVYEYGVDKMWQSWCSERRRYADRSKNQSFIESGIQLFQHMGELRQVAAISFLCRLNEDNGLVSTLLSRTPHRQSIGERLALAVDTPDNWNKFRHIFPLDTNIDIFRRLAADNTLSMHYVNVFRDITEDVDDVPQDIVDTIVARVTKSKLMNEWIAHPNHKLLCRIFSNVEAEELHRYLEQVPHQNVLKFIKRMASLDSYYDTFWGHRGFQQRVIQQLCSINNTPGKRWMGWQTQDLEKTTYAWWTLGFKSGDEGPAIDMFVDSIALHPQRLQWAYAWMYMAGCLKRHDLAYPSLDDVAQISESLNVSVQDVLVSTIVEAYSRVTLSSPLSNSQHSIPVFDFLHS